MKLSILIPTTYDRAELTKRLADQFKSQIVFNNTSQTDYGNSIMLERFYNDEIEMLLLWDIKGYQSIGGKRNQLLYDSIGDFVAFVDSDDRVSDTYVALLMEGIEKGVDCCSLRGIITDDGNNPQVFEHSIKYNSYKTNPEGYEVRYERFPNHLNCIKASIAKQFIFPEKNHGEDTDWAMQLYKSGLIKTEHYIPEVIYFYDYISNK